LKDLGVNLKTGDVAKIVNLFDESQKLADITSSTQKIKVGKLHSHGSLTIQINIANHAEDLEIIQ